MTKGQKAHVEAVLIQRIDDLAKDRSNESDKAIAAITRELINVHFAMCEESEREIKPFTPIYDGLTPEETAAMLADVATAKEGKGFTPVFVGKSGVTYIGGVKLEAVKTIVGFSERGVHEVRITFDTDKATSHYRPKIEEGWIV
ncbi:MAG: hypothetical protein Q4D37_05655 [Oscillospiraceae bacterium]|nr:hypothetical protein [Oscillospiraceae bacterium]